jgi:hypothetical protein
VSGNLILTQTGASVSGHYTWNDGSGTVSGSVSGSTFSGSFNENHYQGSFTLTLSGKSFTGSYSGTNKDTGADISGPFTGTCIAGDCLSNGAPSGVPPITPTSQAPPFDRTTDYRAPGLGAVEAYPTPPPPTTGFVEDGELKFVDDAGNPVEGPADAAVDAQAGKAGKVCEIMLFAESEPLGSFTPRLRVATCVSVVSQVLARADQIRKKKAASGASHSCSVVARSKRRVKSKLKATCTATAQGLHVKIRATSGTLRKALGNRAPKLLVARSALASGPAKARLQVRWHAG